MDKSWFRIILTWVVIIPDLILSYYSLRNPYTNLEMTALGLNFVATTVLFYVYMDLGAASAEEGEEEGSSRASDKEDSQHCAPKLAFAPLIEDMLVWAGLFFLLYNIVPISLYIHNIVGKYV